MAGFGYAIGLVFEDPARAGLAEGLAFSVGLVMVGLAFSVETVVGFDFSVEPVAFNVEPVVVLAFSVEPVVVLVFSVQPLVVLAFNVEPVVVLTFNVVGFYFRFASPAKNWSRRLTTCPTQSHLVETNFKIFITSASHII